MPLSLYGSLANLQTVIRERRKDAQVIAALEAAVAAPKLPSYTVATVPSAAVAGLMIYVTNETGGAVPAFSDGTNWRRVTDRNVVL